METAKLEECVMGDPLKFFVKCSARFGGNEGMRRQVQRMRDVLDGLEAWTLPDDRDYTIEELHGYLRSLVGQYDLTRFDYGTGLYYKGVSWCVLQGRRFRDPEDRWEFTVLPTALAAATLSRCVLQYPLLVCTVPGVVDVLAAALAYLASRFPISRAAKGLWRTAVLDILRLGWVPLLLWENPRLCPPMYRLLGAEPDFLSQVEHGLQRRCERLLKLVRSELSPERVMPDEDAPSEPGVHHDPAFVHTVQLVGRPMPPLWPDEPVAAEVEPGPVAAEAEPAPGGPETDPMPVVELDHTPGHLPGAKLLKLLLHLGEREEKHHDT